MIAEVSMTRWERSHTKHAASGACVDWGCGELVAVFGASSSGAKRFGIKANPTNLKPHRTTQPKPPYMMNSALCGLRLGDSSFT